MSSHQKYTDRSFKSAILLGVASIFDFTGRLGPQYNPTRDPQAEDAEALAGDWQAIGDDLRRAMSDPRMQKRLGHEQSQS